MVVVPKAGFDRCFLVVLPWVFGARPAGLPTLAMAKAELSGRFENAQAAAVREALNVSVTRCTRRATGAIGPIPAEPESWKKYNMGYNQTLAEAYFLTDQWGRIWSGLVNLMKAYDGTLGYKPLHLQIAALFHGKSVRAAAAVKLEAERAAAKEMVAELTQQLVEAKAKEQELENVGGAGTLL